MMQARKVTPPISSDGGLVDFSSIVQSNLQQLFGSAHTHVGINGVLLSAPASNAGLVGDIVIVNVLGTVSLYFKVTASQWYHLGPATKG
jgi:hypothetical protein